MLPAVLALVACTPADGTGGSGGAVANYTLSLAPIVPLDVNPFSTADRIDLLLDSGVGDPQRITLDAPAAGDSAKAEGLPALEGTRIVVEGYAEGELVAWGRSAPITASEGDITATVFVAPPWALGQLGGLPEGTFEAGAVALGSGRFLVMGGSGNRNSGNSLKAIDGMYEIDLENPESSLMFSSVGTMPEYTDADGNAHTDRQGFTLTRLSAGDAGKYLLVGGSSANGYEDATSITPEARLFDPDTLTFADKLSDRDALASARSGHAAIANQQGGVLVWGGFGSAPSRTFTIVPGGELYDPVEQSFSVISGGPADAGAIAVGLADLGEDGTLVAGGMVMNENGEWYPTTASFRVSLRGEVENFSDMDPLGAQAMVSLPGGDVMAFGGVTSTVPRDFLTTGPATSKVWRFDHVQHVWNEAGKMQLARAGAGAAVLDDTHVLIAGGSGDWGPYAYDDDSALSCVEIYDTENDVSDMVGSCDVTSDVGGLSTRAQEPLVMVDEELGVMIAGGVDGSQGAQNGATFFSFSHSD